MIKFYGDTARSFITVKTWAAEFKRGKTRIFYKDRSAGRKTATTDEMIDYVHEIVINHCRLILREIAKLLVSHMSGCTTFYMRNWI